MRPFLAAVALASAILATPAGGQATASLEVRGVAGETLSLGLAELEGLGAVEVTVDENGPATYRGPTLRDVATLAGAPTGRALRGPAMALAILAEADDGYRVVFTIAELDEQFGAREVVVALSRNGAPLGDEDGPIRLVVPEDAQFHARWLRGLARVSLVDLGVQAR